MLNVESNPMLANCWFSRNTTNYSGGGIANEECAPTLANCILCGNTAGSTPEQIAGGQPDVSYSCVQGGWPGVGNISDDPLPIDPDGADDVTGTEDDNLRLRSGSPCIDAGDNSAVPEDAWDLDGDEDTAEPLPVDLRGAPRFVDNPSTDDTGQGDPPVVDMGAYEFQGVPPPLYVNAAATGADDGSCWADACQNLQDALAIAVASGGDVLELWVAEGVYPYTPAGPGGDRQASFVIPPGLTIYGGFAGGETALDQRDIANNPTILSGDLNGDDGSGFINNDENSYHVVTVSSTLPGYPPIIDGCSIVGGNANGAYPHMLGGGVYIYGHELVLRNCTVRDNFASAFGGGSCQYGGGGISLINCVVRANEAGSGGGVGTDVGAVLFTNCTFTGNTGGGLWIGGGVTIANCIFWGNTDGGDSGEQAQIHWGSIVPTVDYTCVQGLTGALGGTGNIGDDPLLADPDGPDDVLGTPDDDLHLSPSSPCIDAGDNTAVPIDVTTDLDGNPRFVDDPTTPDTGQGTPPIVDMGAYEYQTAVVALLDIKPGSCPNPFNRNSHGVLPLALVGTDAFDVMEIDVSSVLLSRADGVGGEVAPNEGPPGPHSESEDVATPFDGEPCDCHQLEGDGAVDLSMKFRSDDVVEVLELDDLDSGALVELVVTGNLLDGTPFEASDCVRLVPPGTPPGALAVESNVAGAWVEVSPLDDTLDGGGFAAFERFFPQSAVVALTAEETFSDRTFTRWIVDGVPQPVGALTVQVTIDGVGHNLVANYRQPTKPGHQLDDHVPTTGGDLSR